MTKTLIITASLPYPPASGGAIRVYGILKGLHAAGHQITLMALDTALPAAELTAYCHEIITLPPPVRTRSARLRDLLLSRQPDIAKRLYSAEFAEQLAQVLKRDTFDLIQIEAIEMACYLPLVKQQTAAKIVFDTFNAEYKLQEIIFDIDRRELKRLPVALYSWIQARRIKRFERAMCRLADAVIAVSPEDADALRGFRDDQRVFIIPSGITVSDYTRSDQHEPDTLVFTGKMDYRPNVDAMLWFTEAIFPHIQAEIPHVKLWIVGQQPHARLDPLKNHPAITLTGWVDSVQPYLNRASVYIAPLRMGSGTRLKLLEAMASGCAIVATDIAAAGLLDDAKRAIIRADSIHDTAQAIIQLLRQPDQQTALGDAAHHAVSQHYDWAVIIPHLLAVYKELGLG